MACRYSFIASVAFFCIVYSQPIEQGVVLRDAPKEVLFRVQSPPKPFELDCSPESGDVPAAKYEWLKNDQLLKSSPKIKQQNGKLVFEEPKDSDEGVYQCHATTSAGMASGRPIKVKKTYINLLNDVKTEHVKPVEGRPFKLDCQVPSGYPRPTVEWKKQSKDGEIQAISYQRMFSPQGNLYFSNASESDVSNNNKYVCFVKSPALDKEVAVSEYIIEGLTKDDKPADNEVVKQYTSSDFTAVAGEQTGIYCIFGGNPMPHPDWWKDGVNVNNSPGDRVTRYNRSKGKRLLIKETWLEDAGQYTCVIDNEVGKVQNYTIRLSVVSAPLFTAKPEKKMAVKQGGEIFIPCEVSSSPKAEIVWTYNAKRVVDSKYNINEKGLRIKNIQKNDAGYYGCLAANNIGYNYTETLVQVN